jgi:NhaA family Na+:H+ antiporter
MRRNALRALGILLGLVLAKQLGIMLASRLVVPSGIGELPGAVHWRQLYGVGWLAAIGFTMALFIAELGLDVGGPLVEANVGMRGASHLAGAVGFGMLRALGRKEARRSAPRLLV